MKNLINICKMLPILLLVLGSCKEKSADPQNAVISTSELADYYLVAERTNTNQRLVVFYFTKDGDAVTASSHLQYALRVKEVNVENSIFSFDFDSDGKFVYTFELERDANGNLKLKSSSYSYSGGANELSFATIAKRTDAISFENDEFRTGSSPIKFGKDITSNASIIKWFDNGIYPFYMLGNVGFKTNNGQLFGAVVPSWKNISSPVMLVESEDEVLVSIKQ
ncbi:hypothetical protein L0657_05075 [Dyadobacter sp. CY345]|uniref:hypothetical protein n=1 Tax=Dyadobacter sp. CY345 TaxID=2909335 RepID=UPI001F28D1AF|nr:hypothetical protein [Dyadobacter sp. CY345]MCF2443321.1 hypothetical protein [Dyadobacter sp. CY345]